MGGFLGVLLVIFFVVVGDVFFGGRDVIGVLKVGLDCIMQVGGVQLGDWIMIDVLMLVLNVFDQGFEVVVCEVC